MSNHHLHIIKHLGRILARLKVVDATCGACSSINTQRNQLNSNSSSLRDVLGIAALRKQPEKQYVDQMGHICIFPEKLEALSGNVLIDSYYTTPAIASWTAGRTGLAIYAETIDLCQG